MTLPIAIKAISNCDGCNQCLHPEAPKHSWSKPLKRNKEGHGNQPQSHKAALPTNATKALWGHHEYHEDTHPTTTIIAARASIAATRAQQTKTASFHWSAQEPRVVRLTQRRQLLSPSAWPMQAAKSPQWRWSCRTSATTRRVLPSARTKASSPDAYMASTPITRMASAALIRAIKHANNNNNSQAATAAKNTATVTHAPRIMRATIAGQAANRVAWQSQWHRPQWRKNKRKQRQQKIPFWVKFL